MRLWSGENSVPQGNVVPFLYKYLRAIAPPNSLTQPRTKADKAQNQHREYNYIQHCINHASSPLKGGCTSRY